MLKTKNGMAHGPQDPQSFATVFVWRWLATNTGLQGCRWKLLRRLWPSQYYWQRWSCRLDTHGSRLALSLKLPTGKGLHEILCSRKYFKNLWCKTSFENCKRQMFSNHVENLSRHMIKGGACNAMASYPHTRIDQMMIYSGSGLDRVAEPYCPRDVWPLVKFWLLTSTICDVWYFVKSAQNITSLVTLCAQKRQRKRSSFIVIT